MAQSGSTNPPKSFVRGPLMNDPILNDLLTYWETLRAGRLAPMRSDIDPREIKSALEHTFILEATVSGHPRIRLAGAKVCSLLGMELRGMPIRSLIEPHHREDFDEVVAQVMATPEVVELSLSGQVAGDQTIGARMLLLPLSDQRKRMKRVMGCISLAEALPRPPIRFEVSQVLRTRIVAGEAKVRHLGIQGFSEPEPMFTRDAQPKLQAIEGAGRKFSGKSNGPKLRLVKDD